MKDGCIELDLLAIESLGVAIEEYSEDLTNELKVAMVDTVTSIEKYAKHRCPVDTGNLRASITPEVDGFKEGSVGTNVEYAMAVEYGSRPHDIRPREKKAMRFEKGGHEIFAKRVKHPGSQPQPFLEPAFIIGGRISKKNFDRAVAETQAKARAKLEGS